MPVEVLAAATTDDIDLGEAEQTAILSNTSNGFVVFAPPVAPPVPVTAPAGSPLAGGAGSVVLPLVGALVGFRLGGLAVSAGGVDLEGSLCPGATSGNLPDDFMAAVTGTQCTDWSLSNELQARLNLDAQPTANPSLIGAVRCDPDGRCAEVYAVAAPTASSPAGYCLRHVSGPVFGTTGTTGVPVVGYTPQYSLAPNWYGGSSYTATSYKQPEACPSLPGTQVARFTIWSPGSPTPFLYWAVDRKAATGGSVLTLPEPLREDVQRTIRCVVNHTGGSASASTAPFTLGSGGFPTPVCPSLGDFQWLTSIELWLDSPGLPSVQIGFSDASAEFTYWATQFPECVDGSCGLDLLKNGESCFVSADCAGWMDDTTDIYICTYAGEQQPLSDCYIYGPMFESVGPGYGHHETGEPLSVRTTPSEEDRLALALMDHAWLVHGPTAAGFEFGAEDQAMYARTIAKTCIARGMSDECATLPIFAPGDDVWQAANHDLDAILSNPEWAVLSYANPSPAPPGWYYAYPPCNVDYAPLHCDEYPFRSTAQAGPPLASLRTIDAQHNSREGTLLGMFYSLCNIVPGDEFAVVPISSPTEPAAPVTITAGWCEP